LKYAISKENQDGEVEKVTQEWSLDEKQRLIEAVLEYNQDWKQISRGAFGEFYSPEECALQFLSLPISESLLLKFQAAT